MISYCCYTVWLAKHFIKGASKYFFTLPAPAHQHSALLSIYHGPAILCENSFVFNEELIGRWLQGLTTRLLMSQIPIMIIVKVFSWLLLSREIDRESLFERFTYNNQRCDLLSFSTTSFIFPCKSLTLQRPKIAAWVCACLVIFISWIELVVCTAVEKIVTGHSL